MYLIRIAWRNLTRNWLRTFIAVLAIAAVVIIVVFARGLMVGFTESNFATYIDNVYGHVRLVDNEYNIREPLLPLDYTIDGFQREGAGGMISEIKDLERVEHILPRIRFGAMASIDGDMVRMIGIGIDVTEEKDYGSLSAEVEEGRMPEKENEILVGKGLLGKLEAGITDRITFSFSDAYQSLRGRTFEIVGIRESGVSQLDDNFFYLPLKTAQEVLWLDDQVTELLIFGSDARNAEVLQTDINNLLTEHNEDKYITQVWNRADPLIETYDEVGDIMNLVYVLFILLGSVVVVSTLSMIVRERTSEIGMMAALGLKGKEIMKVFVLEGSFMGLIGSLVGVVIGGIITFYYSRAGLHVEAFAEAMGEMDILVEPAFYLVFDFENLVISFGLGVILVAIACFYPAYKAAKLEPVDAIHYADE